MKGKIFKLFVGLFALLGAFFAYNYDNFLDDFIKDREIKAAGTPINYPHEVGEELYVGNNSGNPGSLGVYKIKDNKMYTVGVTGGTYMSGIGEDCDEVKKNLQNMLDAPADTEYGIVGRMLYERNGNQLPKAREATLDDWFDMMDGLPITVKDMAKSDGTMAVGYRAQFQEVLNEVNTKFANTGLAWKSKTRLKMVISDDCEQFVIDNDWLNLMFLRMIHLDCPYDGYEYFIALAFFGFDGTECSISFDVEVMPIGSYPGAGTVQSVLIIPYEPFDELNQIVYTPDGNTHVEGKPSSAKGTVVGKITSDPDGIFPVPVYTIDQGKEYFTVNENNEVVINVDDIKKGTYDITIHANQQATSETNEIDMTSDVYQIVIEDPTKKLVDFNLTRDAGKDPLYLNQNTEAGRIGEMVPIYGEGDESGRGIRYRLTSDNGANDNSFFTLTNQGVLSIKADLTTAKTYHIEVTASETATNDVGVVVPVAGLSCTKTFAIVVNDDSRPAITDITFQANYPSGKSQWHVGDTGISNAGETTGTLRFTGGTSPNYKTWEIVDASGNAVSDDNFNITGNTVHVKKKLSDGAYAFTVKVTDQNDKTMTKDIVIQVAKKENITITQKSDFYEYRLSNGRIADITKWQKENIIIHPKHATYTQMQVDSGTFQTGDYTYAKEGTNTVSLRFQDNDGAQTNAVSDVLKIDKTKPTITVVYKDDNGIALTGRNPISQSIDIVVQGVDNESGLAQYQFVITPIKDDGTLDTANQIKQNTPASRAPFTYSLVKTGRYQVEVSVTDVAGNVSDVNTKRVVVDNEGPKVIGAKDQSEYKQYYLPRFVSVEDKLSGINNAYYTKDGGTQITITGEIKLTDIGGYHLYAQDNAGNDTTINFKIVPLPDINQIDGSDESKDIIEQVEKELNDIKGKIDDTEKAEYEQWIKDAWDKWNSQRKSELTDEDTGSKVKGEGETTFDPKTELVVQKIDETTLPQLPRKAIDAYDVKLMKNHIIIQPDGSIKVYLPYTENEAPILYQIDENGKVSVIAGQREGNYVTFVSDHLLQYAISNEKQEVQNNDTCVVGPDGTEASGDEVCGKGNENGDKPEKQPDGSVKVPEGGKVEFPNGKELPTPDGATILPDGTVILPDGTEYDPNGNKKGDKTCSLNGKDINVDTDGDGLPDLNLDLDGDCIADLNIDTNFDNIPDIDIDTKGDGKADINMDTNHDGKADLNIAMVKRWVPNKDCTVQGFAYDTAEGFTPYLNVDDDHDGKPDRNIDDNGDGIPDRNIDPDWFDKYGNLSNKANVGGAMTGDNTKWVIWWILFILSGGTLTYSQYKKRNRA